MRPLGPLCDAVRSPGLAVLQAPPGAGKTTRVPLALLDQVEGRILILEPRRVATRAAAERMAEDLGEAVGETVGYRMRGAREVGPETRIEVITDGLLTRMIQSDPELPGVGAVIFDEFHERALAVDLGLALCLEVRGAVRPDLALIVMSATLDAGPVAALMGDAPVITSEGRAYPVETRYAPTRRGPQERIGAWVAEAVRVALAEAGGGVLVFLPGAGEIGQVERALGDLGSGVEVRPLYGSMPIVAQRTAIRAVPDGARKVVLATSIAETALTIEDVRVVIDAGLARRSRFDAGSGMARLVTERVTRVAPAHVLTHIHVGTDPKARQVRGRLQDALRGRQKM